MKQQTRGLIAAAIGVVAWASSPAAEPNKGEQGVRAQAIQAHMSFLADDLLEGREAGTRGYDIAAKYVGAQFAASGLEPGAGNGSYFQQVPLRKSSLVPNSARLTLESGGRSESMFSHGDGVIIFASPTMVEHRIQAEVVFAGFGIVAPEYGIDAYAKLDVKDKIVAVLVGPPPGMPREAAAHHASLKTKNAIARGAHGILLVYTPAREAMFSFTRMKQVGEAAQVTWLGPDGQPGEGRETAATLAILSIPTAKQLFASAPRSLERVFAESARKSPAGFSLGASVTIERRSRHEQADSANVMGLLPGSDPALAREVMVITTHLDHLGVSSPVSCDAIYNGALDNAIGVAGTIEVARALASGSPRPRRSILFVATTAEEKGLIGSDYFAHFPTVARDRIVANINFDGAMALFDFNDIVAYGAEHSTLGQSVEQVAAEMGLVQSPDPYPDRGTFTGSDHYSFVKQGVPAVFLLQGVGKQADGREGKETWDRWMATHYHQPSDDMKQSIDFAAAAKFAEVYRRLTLNVANDESVPRWYAGDLFGEQYAPKASKVARPAAHRR